MARAPEKILSKAGLFGEVPPRCTTSAAFVHRKVRRVRPVVHRYCTSFLRSATPVGFPSLLLKAARFPGSLEQLDFENIFTPVIKANCNGCNNANSSAGNATTHNFALAGGVADSETSDLVSARCIHRLTTEESKHILMHSVFQHRHSFNIAEPCFLMLELNKLPRILCVYRPNCK